MRALCVRTQRQSQIQNGMFWIHKQRMAKKSVTNLQFTIMMSSGKWTYIDPAKQPKNNVFFSSTSFTLCCAQKKTWLKKSLSKGHLQRSICICSKCNFHCENLFVFFTEFVSIQRDKQFSCNMYAIYCLSMLSKWLQIKRFKSKEKLCKL